MDSTFEWYFKGFSDELSAELKYIEPLPNRPVYHMGQQGEVFHPDWSIRVNVEHILGDAENLARIPAKVRKLKNLPLLLETAAELARRKAIIEPGIVVAQAYAGRGQFLLPMYLTDTNKPDIAMTLSLMDGYNYLYYDPFGNLKTEVIYTDDTNEEGNQTEHSRTEYTYDTLQRPLSKEVYDGVGTLLYKELSSYEITSDYVKETVTLFHFSGETFLASDI